MDSIRPLFAAQSRCHCEYRHDRGERPRAQKPASCVSASGTSGYRYQVLPRDALKCIWTGASARACGKIRTLPFCFVLADARCGLSALVSIGASGTRGRGPCGRGTQVIPYADSGEVAPGRGVLARWFCVIVQAAWVSNGSSPNSSSAVRGCWNARPAGRSRNPREPDTDR